MHTGQSRSPNCEAGEYERGLIWIGRLFSGNPTGFIFIFSPPIQTSLKNPPFRRGSAVGLIPGLGPLLEDGAIFDRDAPVLHLNGPAAFQFAQ